MFSCIFPAWCLFQAIVIHVFLNFKSHGSIVSKKKGENNFCPHMKKIGHFLYVICLIL